MALLEREVFAHPVPADDVFQRAMALILAKARDDARGAVRLAKAGYGPQSAGLCRSLVEASINSRYIEKDPFKRGNAFIKSINEQNRSLSKKLRAHTAPQDVVEAMAEAERTYEASGWPFRLVDRAHAVEDPSYTYDIVFQLLSQQLHSTVSSLAGQVQFGNDGGYRIRVGRGPEWVDEALATVFIHLSQVVEVSYKAFGKDTTNFTGICQKFHEAHISGALRAAV